MADSTEDWVDEANKVAEMFSDFSWPDQVSFSEAVAEQLTKMTQLPTEQVQSAPQEKCRDSGSAFHVDYIMDADGNEQLNHTHTIICPEPADDEEDFGWVLQQADSGRVQVLAGSCEGADMGRGWDVEHEISPQTAAQLGDAFTKASQAFAQRPAPSVVDAPRERELFDAGFSDAAVDEA